jgi:Flp pilus assembly protein TadD
LVGCGQAPTSADGVTYFHPLQAEEPLVEPVQDPGPPVKTEEMEGYSQIMEGFRANAEVLFRRADIEKRLDQIEQVFVSTGHYLELVSIYQRVVEKQGYDTPAAPRLAWALVRLGQRQQAKTLIDDLKEARPEDADVHFIDGAYWLNQARESREAAARTVLAWQKTLELDPDYEGFEEASASNIQTQIDRLRQQIGAPPSEVLKQAKPPKPAPEKPKADGESALAESKQTQSRQAPEPEPTSAEPADEPEGPEKVAEAPDDEAEQRKPSPDSVRLTRASLAVSEGDLEQARNLYESVLEDDSDHLRAQFGLLKVRQRDGAAAESLAEEARSLLDHPKLDAQTAYNIGLFARAKLDAEELAESFFDVVRTKDPAFAEQNGL